jgi:hypothetical protein
MGSRRVRSAQLRARSHVEQRRDEHADEDAHNRLLGDLFGEDLTGLRRARLHRRRLGEPLARVKRAAPLLRGRDDERAQQGRARAQQPREVDPARALQHADDARDHGRAQEADACVIAVRCKRASAGRF